MNGDTGTPKFRMYWHGYRLNDIKQAKKSPQPSSSHHAKGIGSRDCCYAYHQGLVVVSVVGDPLVSALGNTLYRRHSPLNSRSS